MSVDSFEVAELLFSLIHRIQHYKAKHLLTRYRVNRLSESRLSERQYQILYVINYANIRTLTEISDIMHLSASSLSLIISKMVKNGYIVKNHDVSGKDKRKIFFTVTQAGLGELKVITDEILDAIECFFSVMDEWQRSEFCEAIELLRMAALETEQVQML